MVSTQTDSTVLSIDGSFLIPAVELVRKRFFSRTVDGISLSIDGIYILSSPSVTLK